MITLSIQVNVLKKNHGEFLETLLSLSHEATTSHSCESFRLYKNIEKEDLIFIELFWSDKSVMNAYLHSKNFTISMGAIKTFCENPSIKVGYMYPTSHHKLLEGNY